MNSITGRDGDCIKEMINMNQVSNYNVETITDAIGEMMKLELKELESLRKLGKPVNILKKYANKEICLLSQTLIDAWNEKVDEWVAASTTPKSVFKNRDKLYHEPYVPKSVKRVHGDKKQEVATKKQTNVVTPRKPLSPKSVKRVYGDKIQEVATKKQTNVVTPRKSLSKVSGRPTKVNSEQKIGIGMKFQQKTENSKIQR